MKVPAEKLDDRRMIAKHTERFYNLGSDVTVLNESLRYAGNEGRITHGPFGEDIQGYLRNFLRLINDEEV